MAMPVSASASGTLGVMSVPRGINSSRIAAAAVSGSSGKPCLLTMTGSTTRGNRKPAAARATAFTISAEPSAPVLAAAGGISSSTASICSSTSETGITSTRDTRTLFCTVSRVTTASP